uniref:Cytidyltransferase-like domain-containing protein n=1 Tax=Phaeomonas parva TaxID=124430 RepID=A0A7S1U456_9STRA|mmetsp:Transcript_30560/g.97515  ORF Transcript_30560/g.97515 Transcript_30560/m.97515 type:complete len:218 (+) Transcript_30560:125-778(+)
MAQSAGEAAQRRVLLFGLSANPPTAAHAGMVAELVTKSDFDAIWVLPVYVHMLDSKRNKLEKFEHRVAMCRMAFEHLGSASCPVGVKEIERIVVERRLKQRGGSGVARVGTADVLDHLSAAYPGTDFSFVMGADTYRDLRAGVWRRSDELLRRLNFVVFPRGDIEVHPRPQDTLLAAASGWGDVSSSKVKPKSEPKPKPEPEPKPKPKPKPDPKPRS